LAGENARAASSVPDGLFTAFVKIDRRLTKMIDGVEAHCVDLGLLEEMNKVEDAKLRMVDEFFDQPVYGVKFSDVFRRLNCIDNEIAFVRGTIAESHGAIGSGEDEKILRALKAGKKCKQTLEEEFHNVDEGSAQHVSGSLKNAGGSLLGYAVQTSHAADALKIVVPREKPRWLACGQRKRGGQAGRPARDSILVSLRRPSRVPWTEDHPATQARSTWLAPSFPLAKATQEPQSGRAATRVALIGLHAARRGKNGKLHERRESRRATGHGER
jgi:hypothetical protein